jgi:hypothetical protein
MLEVLPEARISMKIFLLLTCVVILFAATGCFNPSHSGGGPRNGGQMRDGFEPVSMDGPAVIVGADMGR